MLVKGEVLESSATDPDGMGRVVISSSGLWVRSLRIPVLHNVPLNVGDTVMVDISCGVESPLVLGRSRDMSFRSSSDVPASASLLWDSVGKDGSWSMAYVAGNEFRIANSDGVLFRVSGGLTIMEDSEGEAFRIEGGVITAHGGRLGGMLIADKVLSYMSSLSKDLSTLKGMLTPLTGGPTAVVGVGTAISTGFNPTTPPIPAEFIDDKFTH